MAQLVGLPPARYFIDAFDMSTSALEAARRGVYSERTLAHIPAELQHACAERQGKHWSVHAPLRERVRFARRNLAEPGALGEAAQYHLILCRNLFIYLAPGGTRGTGAVALGRAAAGRAAVSGHGGPRS